MMQDEFEDASANTYAKYKSQHEIDPDQFDKFAPKAPVLDDLDQIIDFGTINKYIEDNSTYVVLVQPSDPYKLYDLDNFVALKSKEVIGFVFDLVGHVTKPVYSVRIYPEFIDKLKSQGLVEIKNQLVDQKVYLVAKTLKVINASLPVIMAKKGCDASNVYDEELPENEREFSDDDKEKEHKKALKAKKKKNRNREEGEISGNDGEEEEKM